MFKPHENAMNQLDQFYTKPRIAHECWDVLQAVMAKFIENPVERLFFVEPSAGDGVFYEQLPVARRVGFDLAPKSASILQRDFLQCRYHPPIATARVVIIGNPPFGKRARLAIEFVNKAFTMGDTVAFIVPIIFKKYFIHKQITADARLIYTHPLDRNAFRTATQADYVVNTEFQIWTRLAGGYGDLRLFTPPPIAHPDFVMYQYNNTRVALKLFNQSFDFAVPCQGWQDYGRREREAQQCEKHKQWILFKTHRRVVYQRLFSGLDFHGLANKYTTSIPGFRKGDVVREYTGRYG